MGIEETLTGLNQFVQRQLGETVEYNGEEIVVLIANQSGDREEVEVGTDTVERMEITVLLGDVAAPAIEDVIEYKSKTWQVVRIIEICENTKTARLEVERRAGLEGARGDYRK